MKKHPFTMIEVAFALGVVAIAIVSILGLFPLGFSAAREGMAETYAAETADEMLHWLENEIRSQVWNGGYSDESDFDDYAPDDFPAVAAREDFDVVYEEFQTLYRDDSENGLYKAIRFVDLNDNDTYEEDDDILDFAAIITVKRSQVEIPGDPADIDLDYDIAVGLEMEISWPAWASYENRDTRQYFYEIFRRN